MAIKRRIRMVPFNYTVPEDKIIVNLEQQFFEEGPDILAFLLFLAHAYYDAGGGPRAFPPGVVVDEASREYLESEDLVGRFVQERLEPKPGSETSSSALFEDFIKWEEAEGIKKKMSKNKFGDRLSVHLPNKRRKNTGVYYLDIAIKYNGSG
jgi:putative DNA primase/helicase